MFLKMESVTLTGMALQIELLACETKGVWFDDQSGHVPELPARRPVGGQVRGDPSMSLSHIGVSLPLFSPLPPQKNK